MVQIINEPGFFGSLAQSLQQSAPTLLKNRLEGKQAEANIRLGQSLGLIPADLDPKEFRNASPSSVNAMLKQKKSSQSSQSFLSQDEQDELVEELVADGMPRQQARIYAKSGKGTQNTMARIHEDLKLRGLRQPVEEQTLENVEDTALPTEDIPKERTEFDWPEIPPPPETTPAERVKMRQQNQKENNPRLLETRDKLQQLDKTDMDFAILTDINDSGKLPRGLGSIVINSSGELRPSAQLTGQVNKETQRFVKTVNDFISGAKNFFGARVTNFDLQSFKARLPSLLNTDEGRRVIIEQMRLNNQLESVHARSEMDAFKHYGNSANLSDIISVTDERVADQEAAIISKLNHLTEASDKLDMMAQNPERFRNYSLWITEDGKFQAVHDNDRQLAIDSKMRPWHD